MSSIIVVGLHGEFLYLNPRHQSSAFQHFAAINSGLEFKTFLYFSAKIFSVRRPVLPRYSHLHDHFKLLRSIICNNQKVKVSLSSRGAVVRQVVSSPRGTSGNNRVIQSYF